MNATFGTNIFGQPGMALLVFAPFVVACNGGASRSQFDSARPGTAFAPSSETDDIPSALAIQHDERVTELRALYDELSARHQELLQTLSEREAARAEVSDLNELVDSLSNELIELNKTLAELTTQAGELDQLVQGQESTLVTLKGDLAGLEASKAQMQRRIQELDLELNPTRDMSTALWYLFVETSDMEKAGTNARLQVILGYVGGLASSSMADLAHDENKPGSKEFYLFTFDQSVPLNLERFTLTHSNTGKQPGWHCRRARLVAFVEVGDSQRAYVVADTYVNRWLKDLEPGLMVDVPLNAKPVELSAPERDAILSAIAKREAKLNQSKEPATRGSEDLSPMRSGA